MLRRDSNKNMYFLLVLPVLIIVVSGCFGTTVTTGNGVDITEFKSDFPEYRSYDSVKLELRVQNTGQARAREVRAELTGIDVMDWGAFGGITSYKNIGDLIPQDPDTNTPGEIKTARWTELEAPELAKGQEHIFQPMVKVSYDYTTTATKYITVVEESELRKIIQRGETLPSKLTEYTAGPFSVEVKTGNFVKTSVGDRTYDIFPIYIEIVNTQWESGGTVIPDGYGGFEEMDYPVDVEIEPPSGADFVYTGYWNDCTRRQTIDLWQGKHGDITCELEIVNPPSYREEWPITVTLTYRYQTQATTQITVFGTEERYY